MKVKHFIIILITGYVIVLLLQVFLSDKHEAKQFYDFYSNSDKMTLVWWTPMINDDRIITCNNYQCLSTANRSQLQQRNAVAIFYGSSFSIDDLPVPKRNIWALFHEESPKNLPLLSDIHAQRLFDITSTFSRFSSMPVTLQYLQSIHLLTTTKYYKSVGVKNNLIRNEKLAPILYLQSDKDTPSERDKYVKELMKYVPVDSYGACLNNKAIPDNLKLNKTYDLFGDDLMEFVSRYKFIIAIENARCDDYITEKLWRSLIVGAVPIYLGSRTIKDWLPNKKSAILVDDFKTMQELAEHIKMLNSNDNLYNSYLDHKRKKLINNPKLIDAFADNPTNEDVILAFECFVCEHLHMNKTRFDTNASIYDCDELTQDNIWWSHWQMGKNQANNLVKIANKNE